MKWTTIQLGSREHYAIPRALHHVGRLETLITDAWLNRYNSLVLRPFMPSLATRRDDEIPHAFVRANTFGRLFTDLRLKFQKKRGWDAIQDRNQWFGQWVADLMKCTDSHVVFSYSYVAILPFVEAKKRHVRCILGQIDPGPFEDIFVQKLTADYQHLRPPGKPSSPTASYWRQWQEELALADKIVVNSSWSRNLLLKANVPEEKIVEIPLAYGSVASRNLHQLSSIDRHPTVLKTSARLQTLFLGSVILRKGIGQLLDAILMLVDEPIDFTIAGPIGIVIPEEIRQLPNVRFLGPVDRVTAKRLYHQSDIFLFPTLSDGFGLTQLEALANGLPIISSLNCGRVVEDGINGLLLSEVTPTSIADAIKKVALDRDLLNRLRLNAFVPDRYHPRHLPLALLSLEA